MTDWVGFWVTALNKAIKVDAWCDQKRQQIKGFNTGSQGKSILELWASTLANVLISKDGILHFQLKKGRAFHLDLSKGRR